VADAVGPGERGDLKRAEIAEPTALAGDERAARITRDAGETMETACVRPPPGSLSPFAWIVTHDEETIVPGRLAPSTPTGVPCGREPASQPFVAVSPSAPEQCARLDGN
jgi:hypothetical protein